MALLWRSLKALHSLHLKISTPCGGLCDTTPLSSIVSRQLLIFEDDRSTATGHPHQRPTKYILFPNLDLPRQHKGPWFVFREDHYQESMD
jgi:hypothetical protein